jgi:hypothetical protein
MFAFFSRPGTSSLLNTKNELLQVTVTIRGTGHREVTFAVGELGPGSGNHPPCWGAGHRMGTGWRMRACTRTGRTQRGDGAPGGWSRIR